MFLGNQKCVYKKITLYRLGLLETEESSSISVTRVDAACAYRQPWTLKSADWRTPPKASEEPRPTRHSVRENPTLHVSHSNLLHMRI